MSSCYTMQHLRWSSSLFNEQEEMNLASRLYLGGSEATLPMAFK